MTDENNDTPPMHARFAQRRADVEATRAISTRQQDRAIETILLADARSKNWSRSITCVDTNNGAIETIYLKTFHPPLLKAEHEALIRALTDYGVIDDPNTNESVYSYRTDKEENGLVWRLGIPEAAYDKIALAREVYEALHDPDWQMREYKTSSITVHAYSKDFSAPLADENKQTTPAGAAVEVALRRLGLVRGKDYDWNDEHPERLSLPANAYARAIKPAAPQPESPGR